MTKITVSAKRDAGQVVDLAPSVADLYKEVQKARDALAKMAALLERIAATMPDDNV
jgi:hypothetical protein